MKLGAVGIEVEGGEIRNRFEELRLGKNHEVLVPTLVVVGHKGIEPMFELSAEPSKTSDRRVRIMARCINNSCTQLYLEDESDRNATEFFTPQSGRQLKSYELPSVIMHRFGWTGGMIEDVSALFEEASTEPWVGRVARIPNS